MIMRLIGYNNFVVASILFALVFIISACSEETANFINDWDEDVYYFSENLKEDHVDLFFNISESEFDQDITSLRKNTSTFTEQKIIFELNRIIGKISDSHTRIEFNPHFTLLPFGVIQLDDGLILTEVDIEHEQFLGRRIIAVNDMPISEVFDKFRSIIPYENESNFKNQVVNYMLYAEFYFQFGISDKVEEIMLSLDDGNQLKLSAANNQMTTLQTASTPLFLEDVATLYWFEELAEDNMLYIQYNSCRERNDLSFQSFTNQIVNRINNNSDIDKVVIDLRHNGGGNSAVMHPLIDALEDLVDKNRLSKNQIYLIIGRKTFSSAILNTIELKDRIDLKIYGEPSGGKPNHHGEVKSFRLPNSLLLVSYSTKYFKLTDGDEDSIYPDVTVAYNTDHFLNGIDPVLEMIKTE